MPFARLHPSAHQGFDSHSPHRLAGPVSSGPTLISSKIFHLPKGEQELEFQIPVLWCGRDRGYLRVPGTLFRKMSKESLPLIPLPPEKNVSPNFRSNAWLVPAGVALALLLTTPIIAPAAGKEGAMPSRKKLAGMSAAELKRIEPRLMEAAARMPDKEMSDPMPEKVRRAAPVAVSRGELEGTGFFHRGSGGVIIYRLADGVLLLRLEKNQSHQRPCASRVAGEASQPRKPRGSKRRLPRPGGPERQQGKPKLRHTGRDRPVPLKERGDLLQALPRGFRQGFAEVGSWHAEDGSRVRWPR